MAQILFSLMVKYCPNLLQYENLDHAFCGCESLQVGLSIYMVTGHFNPGLFNPKLQPKSPDFSTIYILTMNFSTSKELYNLELFYPRLFTPRLFNNEKSGVEKSKVEILSF